MPADPGLHAALDNARRELLDLTARNRLLSTVRSGARSTRLEIVDELSAEVFRYLVVEGKAMSFLAAEQDERAETPDGEEPGALSQPDDEADLAARQTDDKLQTPLPSDQLQKRLLKLFYDARMYEEEQGVSILYLALGFLKWYEDSASERARFAPLLLVPVILERSSASARFKLRFADDDMVTNLSLQARLKADFGIELPDVPEMEELSPDAYFEAVARAVEAQPRFEVIPNDIVLWFFSFSKFLMYRDLDPANWPEDRRLDRHPIIRSLLQEGFAADPPLCGDDAPIDPLIPPLDMIHVLDADSSQAVAIEEVKRGRSLVIQGPPGTGKSQTIANLIAAAVKAGKRILFVAEKMAALDVVRRRMNHIGLGDMCLELHSHKANKRAVLDDLERTLALGQPQVGDIPQHCSELAACRDRLNGHLKAIHTSLEPSGLTPYQVLGELVRLRARGTAPPPCRFADSLQWTRDDFHQRRGLLSDLAEHLRHVGVPKDHPWRGVELDAVLPMDVERVAARLPATLARLDRLIGVAAELADTLKVDAPARLRDVSAVAQLAQRIESAPAMDRRGLANVAWTDRRQQIDHLIETGKCYGECRKALDGVVVEAGWDTDVSAARRDLAAYGRSWLRIFYGAYRRAQAALRGILASERPMTLDARVALLDRLIEGQNARDALQSVSLAQLGREVFGSLWNGPQSDFAALSSIAKWELECREAGIDARFREIYAGLDDRADLRPLLEQIRRDLKPALNELRQLTAELQWDTAAAFGTSNLLRIPLREMTSRLRQWLESPEGLSRWVTYRARHRHLAPAGMAELAAELHEGRVAPREAVPCFEMAHYEALIRSAFGERPELAAFDGASHEQVVRTFQELDRQRIELAREEVAQAHFEALPRHGASVGEVGVLRREMQKKRRHLPIRRLLAEAGRGVQAIKPVFMMSPISVAQYLEPGTVDFDLLLIDEASQVEPVEALGAVARAKQFVVVGDSKQLPPTRFFTRMLGEDGEESDPEAVLPADMESILGLGCAQGMAQQMLQWHYRSRHHSLIAVSNHEFYDDRLYVIPSPGEPGYGQGLVFHRVEGGVFDRGGSATNRVEAKAVAEAVMAHARQRPEKSLGVGAFSVSQRDAILDELELLRRAEPSLERFFVTGVPEPFFVKNLENIQGDERDVIFISVGYGRDASGMMSMNFGPLSNEGGERRLNVLISRAREGCRVFSSITADDIDLARARSRGAQAFKVFLKYAETGQLGTARLTGRDYDSEFERQVARQLAAHGFQTHPQVGVAGFFLDLAVVDPESPGRYLLGIECDGANYHRSRSARDRDRLRQAVLEDRGWMIHRIWSTDWFQRPEEELRKVLAAIEQGRIRAADRANGPVEKRTEIPQPRSTVEREACDGDGCENDGHSLSRPYVLASFRISAPSAVHDTRSSDLARVIARIVDVEGPIHEQEIARRVAQLWGLQRTGKRVREAVESALRVAENSAALSREGEFYLPQGRADLPVRNRAEVDSPSLRQPELLPPMEIRKAVTAVVRIHLGVRRDDAVTQVARLFGFRTTSARLARIIEREVDRLLASHELVERGDKLSISEESVA